MSAENKSLCLGLLQAETEAAAVKLLTHYGYWHDASYWRAYGDKENNWGVIGSQHGEAAGALVEKLVNSIDAVLMRECLTRGLPIEGEDAPESMFSALQDFFGIRDGNLAKLSPQERTTLARNIGLIATGRKGKPNYIVFDRGEGQTPRDMPATILSLSESNKLRIPFVQGEFNMGGSGALPFCGGKHNLQLVVSRRHQQIASADDSTARDWGFTIVRRQDPARGESHSIYKYLAPHGEIPTFAGDPLTLPKGFAAASHAPRLEWGTVIKLYEYEMTGAKGLITRRLYEAVSLLLPRPGLPIRFYEFRDYRDRRSHPETTMHGLLVRLDEDKSANIEPGFPVTEQMRVHGEPMRLAIYAFKKGRDDTYRRSEGIIFTVNGQTHHDIPKRFFARHRVKMSYLADSLLVIVDASRISQRARERLFMTNRDQTRRGELYVAIERRLEEIISENARLKALRDRRRSEQLREKLSDSKPLKEMLSKIIKQSPSLAALFITGKDLTNPFKPRRVGETRHYDGKDHPELFLLFKKHRKPRVNERPINRHTFRVQFETDVVDDYFEREAYPGEFELRCNGGEVRDYRLKLQDGVATLHVALPAHAKVGDRLRFFAQVKDEMLFAPIDNEFEVLVTEAAATGSSNGGSRKPPAGKDDGEREEPDEIAMPQVIDVYEDDWARYDFSRETALVAKGADDSGYDFYVNMDNLHLRWELKALGENDAEPELLKSSFKYALVLIGMAILKEAVNEGGSFFEKHDLDAEGFVKDLTMMLAPVVLPMIKTLGDGME